MGGVICMDTYSGQNICIIDCAFVFFLPLIDPGYTSRSGLFIFLNGCCFVNSPFSWNHKEWY